MQPQPPSPEYVALGMFFTNSAEPPPLECMRCVHKSWCVEVPWDRITRVWDDRGTGGKPGSIWIVNSLQHAWVTVGYDKPQGPFYELRDMPFMLGERGDAKET